MAQFAEVPELQVRELTDAQTGELKAMVARREDLLEMLVAEKHRLEHAPKRLHRKINGHIDYLRKRVKHLDDDIDRTVRGSELWWEKAKLLTSVPGVGLVLCAALLARLPELQARRIRMVFVADEIPLELASVVEFLNAHVNETHAIPLHILTTRTPRGTYRTPRI